MRQGVRRRSGASARLALESAVRLNEMANAMRACSACAGDYEDPDRTAWTPEEDSEQEGSLSEEAADEFPVEE